MKKIIVELDMKDIAKLAKIANYAKKNHSEVVADLINDGYEKMRVRKEVLKWDW